jgi:hypothetical protein
VKIEKACRGHDFDAAKRPDRKQILITRDDTVGAAAPSQLEEFVVTRITALCDLLGGIDFLGDSDEAS